MKKLATWHSHPIELYHYRTQDGIEVDFILEDRAGRVVGVEVKASETLSSQDWKGLEALEKDMGEQMVRGIILYPDNELLALGKKRIAIPLSSLWC